MIHLSLVFVLDLLEIYGHVNSYGILFVVFVGVGKYLTELLLIRETKRQMLSTFALFHHLSVGQIMIILLMLLLWFSSTSFLKIL